MSDRLVPIIYICTRFEDEPFVPGEHYAVEGDPETRLRSLTDLLWTDYAIRQGHAHVRVEKPLLGLRACNFWRVYERRYHATLAPDWRDYRVYLAGDTTTTPLDLDKTLGELGLSERNTWVRFERVTEG